MNEWLELVGGGLLLYFGAEWFVGGASSLALALRVPQLLVGLTVVAYGTSAPEVIVGIAAAGAGHGEVALGNVIGSNITNVGLILGVAALIRPARVDGALRRRELPVLVASTAAIPLLLLDAVVSRLEAAGLLCAAVGYTAWMVSAARGAAAVRAARREAIATSQTADAAGAPATLGAPRAVVVAAGGLAVLLIGGHLFVGGAVSVAHALGMSERLVGLTIVALGTSLPELATSAIAAVRGHSDLAVGNVVGSNIFNSLLCLGAAGWAGTLHAPLSSIAPEVFGLISMTGLAIVLTRSERTISRLEGSIAVGSYTLFSALVLARG